MNYLMKKAVNLNGQDMMLAPLDIDFAHRTISLTGEIDEDVATVMNSALRCLARDSEDDITIYMQNLISRKDAAEILGISVKTLDATLPFSSLHRLFFAFRAFS